MKPMTIGELSRLANVKVTTIRYYESIRLMPTPDRSPTGRRLYGAEAVHRLSFIRQARDIGFPMETIRDLIDVQTRPDSDCGSVDAIARQQLTEVQRRLSKLMALETELKRMLGACHGGQVDNCQVLAALNDRI